MSDTKSVWARPGRGTIAVAMSAALTLTLGLTLPAPAQAYVGAGNLKNYATGRCLDSDYAGNAYAQAWNGGLHQQWNHDA